MKNCHVPPIPTSGFSSFARNSSRTNADAFASEIDAAPALFAGALRSDPQRSNEGLTTSRIEVRRSNFFCAGQVVTRDAHGGIA